MSKASTTVPADKLALYEKLVATNPQVERKGAAMPYTSVNGHMFSFLTSDGKLAIRLPDQERDEFLKQYRTTLCEQHGVVMREYAVVPDALLKKTAELKTFFEASYRYASSLKPKASAKSAGAKKTRPAKKGRK